MTLETAPSLKELSSDFRTATGERRRVKIPGRAIIDMDAQTNIRVPPSGSTVAGGVELVSGRADVQVLGGGGFALGAGAGTALLASAARVDMRYLDKQACLTCLAGTVRLRHADGEVLNLSPRQQVQYDRQALGAVADVDVEAEQAWRRGVLMFRDTALGEVVEELNRYRRGRVMVLGDEVSARVVSGRFDMTEPDAVIEQLRVALGLGVHRYPGGLVLLT